MKFKDIKVGDIVYIQKEAKESLFSHPKYFWVPESVKRVTPKRFVIDGCQYKKEDGSKIGGWGDARLIGDKKVQDESREMEAFIRKAKMWGEILDCVEKLKNIRADHRCLREIHKLVSEAGDLV